MAAKESPRPDEGLSPPEDAAGDDLRDEPGPELDDDSDELDEVDEAEDADEVEDEESAELEGDEQTQSLDIDVAIEPRSTCERHVTVTVPRADIARYYDKEFSELVTSAEVPGFRPGRVPRKVVEARFRKDVTERVKSSLLVDSIGQINKEYDLSPISEPDLKLDAVEMPDDGPMTFEFDLEVRPEFDLPEWKGLKINRPVYEFTEKDVDRALERALADHGQLVPFDGPAEPGDYITTNLAFTHAGVVLGSAEEEVIRIRPVLSFRDGKIEGFDQVMAGVRAGETRACRAQLTQDAPNVALRGVAVNATFEVLEVKKLELPDLTPEFLESLGGFESEADLRDAVRDNLERQLDYIQHQRARQQVTAALTASADWELPPGLLERQSRREMERAMMELRRSGFSNEEIRAHQNYLRQNSREATARALKEHFILERIAEEEEIVDEPGDYETEIRLLAAQSDESPRRVRARLEKSGGMDVLRNQIIERKVVERILSHAEFQDVPWRPEETEAEAVDWAAGGGEPTSDIPEAQPEGREREEESESEA
jgi:trigger factor